MILNNTFINSLFYSNLKKMEYISSLSSRENQFIFFNISNIRMVYNIIYCPGTFLITLKNENN
jgi:hypothetical protein